VRGLPVFVGATDESSAERIDMARKSIRQLMGMALSIGGIVALASGPLLFAAVQKPSIAPATTPITNGGILVNAYNPSDDVHQIPANIDPTNHQISSKFPNTTADFVIQLSGVTAGTGANFTAPITASYHTASNGSTTSFTPTSGTVSFPSRYAQQYQIIKVPVHYNATQYARGTGAYTSFNFVISSAVNATIGSNPATVYIENGVKGPIVP
jgi:hypothetical protein